MTERQSKLIKLVNLYQKIEVSRLAELLDVSQVTIRKDLDHLEEEGLLSREHGYALIKNANDINTRLTINYDKKLEIATKAAEMVSNGETVMLESGSTCALLAEQLAKLKKDVTIITNSAYIAIRIRELPIRKVILLGGEYQKEYQGMVGPLVRKCAKEFYVDMNMLNTKYFIMPLQGGQTVPVQNPYAYGNAWFVDEVKYVNNANEEIDGVGKVNLRHVAVADAKFKEQLAQSVKQDDTSVVKMTQYKPNNLTYEVKSSKGGVIVFSEIYYPGWTATVDGQPAELGRVNYILRALNVKAGSHKVVLDFHPQSLKNTETVAYIGYGVLALLIIIGVVVEVRKRKKE